MATKTINVGTYGQWKLEVTTVSQSTSAFTSTLRFRCYMINNGASGSYNNNGVGMRVKVDDVTKYYESNPFSVASGATVKVVDFNATFDHNSDGTLTIDVDAVLSSTGTTTFGTGGTASLSYTPASLATVPEPLTISVQNLTNTSFDIKCSSNGSGGIAISRLRVGTDDDGTYPPDGWVYQYTTDGWTISVGSKTPGKKYYVWGEAYNTIGWSDESNRLTITMDDVPDPPSIVTLSNVTQTTVDYAWTDGAINGGSNVERQTGWSLSNVSPDTIKELSGNSGTLTGLPPGTKVYIWARQANEYGFSDWGPVASITTVAGAYVNDAGVWKTAIPYVNDNWIWKLALAYVRSYGVWRSCG